MTKIEILRRDQERAISAIASRREASCKKVAFLAQERSKKIAHRPDNWPIARS